MEGEEKKESAGWACVNDETMWKAKDRSEARLATLDEFPKVSVQLEAGGRRSE